jgi:hypothetical protein
MLTYLKVLEFAREILAEVPGSNDLSAIAPWDTVERVVGNLMTPTGQYRARCEVTAFPTDRQLAELEKGEP